MVGFLRYLVIGVLIIKISQLYIHYSGESYYNLKDISEVREEYTTDIFNKIKADQSR
jgi:hypothetical protein